MGLTMPPAERLSHSHSVAAIRTTLSETELEAAWEEGRNMKVDQALALALEK